MNLKYVLGFDWGPWKNKNLTVWVFRVLYETVYLVILAHKWKKKKNPACLTQTHWPMHPSFIGRIPFRVADARLMMTFICIHLRASMHARDSEGWFQQFWSSDFRFRFERERVNWYLLERRLDQVKPITSWLIWHPSHNFKDLLESSSFLKNARRFLDDKDRRRRAFFYWADLRLPARSGRCSRPCINWSRAMDRALRASVVLVADTRPLFLSQSGRFTPYRGSEKAICKRWFCSMFLLPHKMRFKFPKYQFFQSKPRCVT